MKFTEEQKTHLRKVGIYIHGYQLVLTCGGCPEQYDVLDPSGNQCGYIRLRHGYLRVDAYECGMYTVYESTDVKGDGTFEDSERFNFLKLCIEKLIEFYMNKPWLYSNL